MPLIQNGIKFWDAHAEQDSGLLAAYFIEAAEHVGSLTDPAAVALKNWPSVLAPAEGVPMDPRRPWEQLRARA